MSNIEQNPSVLDDCSGIVVGNSYCVEVGTFPTTTKATTTTTTTTTEPTGKPSPTQPGLIDTCTAFYKTVEGDVCDTIVRLYGGTFTVADFIKWNPGVGAECRDMWADTYYCVGIPGTPTAPVPTTLTTTTTATTSTGDPKPSPTQPGLIESCVRFYKTVKDDTCDIIVRLYGGTFTVAEFIQWNPAVGSECRDMWSDTYYCVGIPSTPTTTTTTTTTTTNNGTPSPTQPGMVANCDKFHWVVKGQECWYIARYNGISEEQLNIWNPSIGSGIDCGGLWSEVYVCVHVKGWQPPINQVCNTQEKLWGDNRPAAEENTANWCRDTGSAGGAGTYAKGITKAGCFNAPIGNIIIKYEMVNGWERDVSLSYDQCRELIRLPVDRCDRGGVVTKESWTMR